MWLWQRSGEQPNVILLRRILAVISLGHGCALLWMFVFYGDHTSLYSRQMIEVLLDADVTIVVDPLSKVVNKTMPVVAPTPQTAVAKKETAPATTVAMQPKSQPKKEQPKSQQKKESDSAKAATDRKKDEQKKDIVKKEAEKQKPIEQTQPSSKQESSKQASGKAQDATTQNVIHVGHHEYAALEVQKLIQQEAQRCWKAPIGVGNDVSCQVMVRVDHNGAIRDITLSQQSGVLMYDVHARQAVSRMQFPRGAWGKEVVVYFKQS